LGYLLLHLGTNELFHDYVEAAGQGCQWRPFWPIKNIRTGRLDKAHARCGSPLVRGYKAGLDFEIGARALRATTAANALDNRADIATVQEWLGHGNIAPPAIYNDRKTRREFLIDHLQEAFEHSYALAALQVTAAARAAAPAIRREGRKPMSAKALCRRMISGAQLPHAGYNAEKAARGWGR
jgi:hypothetical protein